MVILKRLLGLVVTIIFLAGLLVSCDNETYGEPILQVTPSPESESVSGVESRPESKLESQAAAESESVDPLWWAERGVDYEIANSTSIHLPHGTIGNVEVKFYRHCNIIDPNVDLLDDSFIYEAVSINSENFHREFIRIYNEHNRTQILDFWYDDDKLYINFNGSTSHYFDWGTTGSHLRFRIALQTAFSLPNVQKVEFLIEGKRGAEASHFNFREPFTRSGSYWENWGLTP